MTMAEGLYAYFGECPLLQGQRLNFDYKGTKPSEYYVEPVMATQPLRKYMSRSSIREQLVTIGSVESYSEDARVNIANSEFYERVEQWVEEQNRLRHFPKLPDSIRVMRLECVTNGYLADVEDNNKAHYQIRIKITYYQKGAR